MMLLATVIEAQNVISVSGSSVSMEFAKPISAGSSVMHVIDQSKWMNYNITVTPPAPMYSITASVEAGSMPAGIEIQIEAGPYQGSGGSNPGTSSGPVTLGATPKVIISNIGTCNTGTGPYLGHQITYTLNISDYSAVHSAMASINIHYSLVQQ